MAEPGKLADRPTAGRTAGPRPRGDFDRDRARVLHSAALRRLAGKTQVVGPGESAEDSGMPRTRLTHSLEVAQIGRGIGDALGCDPDVCDTAGLAHDLGHPPFGHNGEQALNAVAGPCGGFEGNAQTLRILTRLEPKVLGEGRPCGLNLTRACLDAATKYPWPRPHGGAAPVKFGAYPDDLPMLGWVRDGAPGRRRCLEAQVMDWADDVAYSVHDVEDGILAGRISLAVLADRAERAVLHPGPVRPERGDGGQGDGAALEDAATRLLALPAVRALLAFDGSLAALVALKRMTSELVGRFVTAAVAATQARHGTRPLRRYQADLVVPPPAAAEVAVLKALAVRYVMRDPARRRAQARQRELLTELVTAVLAAAPEALEPLFRPAWTAAPDDAGRLRVVIDQVASLTDAHAVRWHHRLLGRPATTIG